MKKKLILLLLLYACPCESMRNLKIGAPIAAKQDFYQNRINEGLWLGWNNYNDDDECWVSLLEEIQAQLLILFYYLSGSVPGEEDESRIWDHSFWHIAEINYLSPVGRRCLDLLDSISRLLLMPKYVGFGAQNTMLQSCGDITLILSWYLGEATMYTCDQRFGVKISSFLEKSNNFFLTYDKSITLVFLSNWIKFNKDCLEKFLQNVPQIKHISKNVQGSIKCYLERCLFLEKKNILELKEHFFLYQLNYQMLYECMKNSELFPKGKFTIENPFMSSKQSQEAACHSNDTILSRRQSYDEHAFRENSYTLNRTFNRSPSATI